MDVLVLILCILVIYGIRITREGFFRDCYSKEYWTCLKGVFAIVIVLHHLALKTTQGVIFQHLESVGFLCVSIFFFISGYGLMKQYRTNKEQYLKHFFRNRIFIILIQYVSVSIVYWILRSIIGDRRSIKEFVLSFFNGNPIAPYSWYIIEILILYFMFFLACIFSKGSYRKIITQISVFLIIFTILSHAVGYYLYWYNTWATFLLGILVAIFEGSIKSHHKMSDRFQIACLALAFITMYLIVIHLTDIPLVAQVLFYQITCIIFILFILCLSKKVQVHNHILQWFGERSLELYLLQGVPLLLYRSNIINIKSDFLYSVATLVTTIVLSHPYHKWNTYFANKFKK